MLIKVKVWVGEKKEGIVRKGEDSFEVRVREKAEQGRANQRVGELLAEFFELDTRQGKQVQLVKGSKSRNKIYKIHDSN